MFETIITKLTNTIRNAVKSVGRSTRHTPWLVPAAIVVLFLVL